MDPASVRRGLLQEKEGEKIRCLTCERRCLLVEGGLGWCRTRLNHQGCLYTLIYGAISSVSVNPIEKKPLYHFYPGSRALTAGSWGCNFGCPWCQNWRISKNVPRGPLPFTPPEDFVAEAIAQGCQGTSISFNEPTLSLEWSCEVFSHAQRCGVYNTYVTNGYMTERALALLIEHGLNAMNIDLKGGAETNRRHGKGVDVEQVWARCVQAVREGVHLEISTLVIPGIHDQGSELDEIARRIVRDLGPETPWHVTGYQPAYRFHAPPTSRLGLERAWEAGRRAGLSYVYIGNLPGHSCAHTYCHACAHRLVRREGFRILDHNVKDGACSNCGARIPGVGWGWEDASPRIAGSGGGSSLRKEEQRRTPESRGLRRF